MQTSNSRYATVEDLKALRLEMHIDEYLDNQRNRPATISGVYWDKDTQTILIKAYTDPVLLKNWPTNEAQLKRLKGTDMGKELGVEEQLKSQKNIKSQTNFLGSLLSIIARRIFNNENKVYNIRIEFHNVLSKKPYQIIQEKTLKKRNSQDPLQLP